MSPVRLTVRGPSAVDPPLAESGRNKIPENRNWQEHVNSVFEGIFAARGRLVRGDARIEVIGASEGGLGAVRYLMRNWPAWRNNISALCLANPLHITSFDLNSSEPSTTESKNAGSISASFTAFVSSRCRAYVLSPEPLGAPISITETQDLDRGCNCYSSGEELNAECILPRAWKHMLAWLDRAYENPELCEEQLSVRETRGAEVVLDCKWGEDGA